jgi:hypothetical protein
VDLATATAGPLPTEVPVSVLIRAYRCLVRLRPDTNAMNR